MQSSSNSKQLTKQQNRIKNLENQIANLKTSKNKQANKYRRNNRYFRRNYITKGFYYKTRAPVANGTVLKTYSNLVKRGDEAQLSFCELFPIYKREDISAMIFINPAKWNNTRTQLQSLLYSQFRPLQINVSYMPVLGTTAQGSISYGAVYNGAYPTYTEDLFMQLPQMAGGAMSSIWQVVNTRIPMGTNLFQNKFGLSTVTEQDIPATIIAIAKGVDVETNSLIGYLAVKGIFSLSGPRTKIDDPVSGTIDGTISTDGKQVQATITNDNLTFLKQGDSFEMLTVNTSQNENENDLGVDWKKVFQTFKKVVATVLEITQTAIKIAIAVAPILLAGYNGNGQLQDVNVNTEFIIIGKHDYPNFIQE